MHSCIVLGCFSLYRKRISKICLKLYAGVGRGISVGIATDYRLDDPVIESLWGARFSAPLQTGPGAQPASCTKVKSGRGVTLTPHPLLVPWSWKGRAIPLLPLWTVRYGPTACTEPQCLYKGDLYLYLLCAGVVPHNGSYPLRLIPLNFDVKLCNPFALLFFLFYRLWAR